MQHSRFSFNTLTTLKVGGTIKKVVVCNSEEEVVEKISHERENFFILGGGSNVLGTDEEYDGTVYIPKLTDTSFEEEGTNVCIHAGAGVVWDVLVKEVVSRGLWGFENLSAIPGTVGGAVHQNIGAYGAVLSDTLHSVRAFDTQAKKIITFTKEECLFGYRTSIFKTENPRYIILSAIFLVSAHGAPNISYKDLAVQFAQDPSPRLSALRTAVVQLRKNKFPNIAEHGTAGSFFLNPVVSAEEAVVFQNKYPDMPVFPLPEGGVKIPLAWILDHVVDAKRFSVGGAFVWEKQALVIATDKSATADDVRTLAEKIQKEVFEKTNIKIIPEVCFIKNKK